MLQDITFRAEKDLIEQARQRAESENTTLNAEFRRWLKQYVEAPQPTTDLEALMDRFRYARPGKIYIRDEINER